MHQSSNTKVVTNIWSHVGPLPVKKKYIYLTVELLRIYYITCSSYDRKCHSPVSIKMGLAVFPTLLSYWWHMSSISLVSLGVQGQADHRGEDVPRLAGEDQV